MRLLCLFLTFCLLCACGAPAASVDSAQASSPAYQMETLALEKSAQFYLAGNGRDVVALHGNTGENSLSPGLYRITTEPLACEYAAPLPERSSLLLGMDGDNGIWVGGWSAEGHGQALRLDLDGTVQMTIDFGPGSGHYHQRGAAGGPFSFTWDEDYFYFLVEYLELTDEHPYYAALVIYDHTGTLVAENNLEDYSAATLGYLDVEEEWMEDLEGREGDMLLEALFPAGPLDTFQLFRFRDGSPFLSVQRHAPIGDEVWDIVCTIDASDFSAAPAGAYPVAVYETVPVALLLESNLPEYDLLIAGLYGLEGFCIKDGSVTELVSWAELDYPMDRNAPHEPQCAVSCDNGLLLQHYASPEDKDFYITCLGWFTCSS